MLFLGKVFDLYIFVEDYTQGIMYSVSKAFLMLPLVYRLDQESFLILVSWLQIQLPLLWLHNL